MRCSARGLLLNAAQVLREMSEWSTEFAEHHQSEYYAYSLQEFAENIERVHKGKDSLAELADCYCLNADSTKPQTTAEPTEEPNSIQKEEKEKEMRREYETVMRLQAPLERELAPEEIALQELVERNGCDSCEVGH